MKSRLALMAFSAVLVATIGVVPALGQSADSITVTVDKASYADGETVAISGTVRDLLAGTPVALIISSPNGNVVRIQQLTVEPDRTFSFEHVTGGPLMRSSGDYTIMVSYGGNTRTAETTFGFGGSSDTPTTPTAPVDENRDITDTTIKVEDAGDLITYEMTGGRILEVTADSEGKALVFRIDATEDGTLTMTIPRTVFDSVEDGEDAPVFVLIDGEEVFEGEAFEETTTSTDRTLTIQFPAGAAEIEVIGTFVIPEFGTIAVMVLVVAIISIVAVSARSRLSIIPRY